MNVRRLEPRDVALIADIDRSEHVDVQYRVDDGHLVEAPVAMADIPPWDPNGSGPHSVVSHIAFCSAVVADGAAFLGAFDDDGDLMGLATVHPTFEPGLAWLATLHVSRAHRRRRAASALWNAGAALAREAGARSLWHRPEGACLRAQGRALTGWSRTTTNRAGRRRTTFAVGSRTRGVTVVAQP
jgi:ribosomal protein S18 acetylase RimI-like enzyme